jgi:hypothetical protein
MLKRLFLGLVLGLLVGSVVAAALVRAGFMAFDTSPFGPASAYLAAAITGALTGLIAGKAIWSADGKIEAGLKAIFGALLAAGGMFALRKWLHLELDLSKLQVAEGAAEIGQLPVVSLPLLAAVLGAFFELDNMGPAPEPKAGKALAGAGANARVRVRTKAEAADESDELDDASLAKKRR